ncbi:O-antigen ligase family protein [Thermodesulfovibrionales bacterium]|nr:O-antigen ligase family protein [Thermodesulfovibrionales bacterium]
MRRSLTLSFLIIGLFVVLSLPEAFDQRFSFGILWIGNVAISPADLLSVFILFFALATLLLTGKAVRSRFFLPLLLLTTILIIQGLRTLETYELHDILRDLRPIAPWLGIIALPQLFRSDAARKQWVKWGICIAVIPPLLVALFTILKYLFTGPFVTFGEIVGGRMTYVNGSVTLLVAMSGVAYILTRARKYQLIFGFTTILIGMLFFLSKSRGFFLEIMMLYGLLWLFSFIKHRTISYTFTVTMLIMLGFTVSWVVLPHQMAQAIDRVTMHADIIESIAYGHDAGRMLHMQQQFSDFLRYPITGTGLGRPYYALAGMHIGERLTSPSDSLFINLAATTGIFGIGVFIWILFRYWSLLWSLRSFKFLPKLSVINKSFIYGLLITFPSLIIGSLIGNALWHYRTPPLHLAVVISVVEVMYRLGKQKPEVKVK